MTPEGHSASGITLADVPPGARAVAVSGGADSVALLTLLKSRRPDLALHVVHLDHQTRGQASSLGQMIAKLMDTTAITNGQVNLDLEPCDLLMIAEEVAARMASVFQEAGCTVQVAKIGQDPVCGKWDRTRIDQILSNLLQNATRYAAGKPVRVAVEKKEGWAVLTVRDQGDGSV